MAENDNATSSTPEGSDAQPRAAVGPTTSALKDKFRSQSIPLEQDFADLIDVADVGRKAVGLSPEQDGKTGAGLEVDSSGKLAVNVAAPFTLDAANALALILGYELAVGESGSLILKHSGTDSGIGATEDRGAYVNVGPGLQVDSSNKVVVTAAAPFTVDATNGLGLGIGWSLELNDEKPPGLEVKQGPGVVRTKSDGLTLKLASLSGLKLSTDGLAIDAAMPLATDYGALRLRLGWELYNSDNNFLGVKYSSSDSGLTSNVNDGLKVNVGPGIQVDSSNRLTVSPGDGLKISGNTVMPDVQQPLTTDGGKLHLALGWELYNSENDDLGVKFANSGSGLGSAYGPGLYVKVGGGLYINSNNQVTWGGYAGMIVMFAGPTAPDGWAFCDGTQGTPDLRDRFIKSTDSGTADGTTPSYTVSYIMRLDDAGGSDGS